MATTDETSQPGGAAASATATNTAAIATHGDNGDQQMAVFRLIARLADNKYWLGRRYAEWCSSAPTLESSVAAAAMAQDELGHARALYPLLRQLAPKAGIAVGPEIEPETRTKFTALAALAADFTDWPDFVAANVLIDGALTQVFQAAQSSSFEPLAARSRKVLQEERTHTLHGQGWLRRLGREAGPVRATTEAALRHILPETLCWFGPTGAASEQDALAAASVLDATPDALRSRFLATIGPVFTAAGLDLPIRQRGDSWQLAEPLPWDRWDAEAYRLG
ncbi:MAG: Phenylacetic acid catabolic protein [Ktedonobacterales bacterium]